MGAYKKSLPQWQRLSIIEFKAFLDFGDNLNLTENVLRECLHCNA